VKPPRERGWRVTVVAIVLALVEVVTLVAGCLSRPRAAVIPLHLGWAFSPVSDTVTIRLRLTGRDGEHLVVPVTIPARSAAKVPAVSVARLYCFARPAGRAIYITIDDGWTPASSPRCWRPSGPSI
jgi:hypothetical protein